MKKITASDFWFMVIVAVTMLLIVCMGCSSKTYMANGCPAGKPKKYNAEPKEKFAYKKYTTQW